MGFSTKREFYSPKYTPENMESPRPDHRTILFWNPELTIENGKATLSFFTADDLGYYRIIVEGLNGKGKIFHGSASFMVNSHH